MVFSRLFGSSGRRDPDGNDSKNNANDDSENDSGIDEPEAEGDADDSDAPEALPDHPWHERALAMLPTGSSTGSKRPEALWGSAVAVTDSHAPSHYLTASGCELTTADDETLIDCTMALGSVALGYADERVTSAVVAAAAGGNVAGLPHVLEVDVAERFCELVPCAERVQFLKSGAEAVAAAVRIARTYTGRDQVIGCGYFGWLDWSSTEAGVPEGVRSNYTRVPFDDIAALDAAVTAAGPRLAAIVLEPVIERLPSVEWIARARALATSSGAALIFDEVKTGFRIATGGYQELSGVTPDLAAFGKAMANGFALSAVCGSAPLMESARKTWISSTLAGETVALAAARAVMLVYAEGGVCEKLAKRGRLMRTGIENAIRASRMEGIAIAGIDPMWYLTFTSPELETGFLVSAAVAGVLFKRGPYNFPSLAHDEPTIHEIESRTSNALVSMRDAGNE